MRVSQLGDTEKALEVLNTQIKLVIDASNLSKQIIDELTKVMSKIESESHGFKNICIRCGYGDARGWLCATCSDEHVTTSRICKDCYDLWVRHPGTHNCPTCKRMVWDWALKKDGNKGWNTNWPVDT